MRRASTSLLGALCVFVVLAGVHSHLLRLPYFWDEAGYYIPAALENGLSDLPIAEASLRDFSLRAIYGHVSVPIPQSTESQQETLYLSGGPAQRTVIV